MEVNIRPLQEEDAYTSVKWRNIPEIWAYTASAPDKEITIEDELNWIRKVMADPTSKRFAILADGVYVGNIYLTNIKAGTAEYHIFIGEQSYWGKGIARKASNLIIKYGLETLGLKNIELKVKEDNKSALGLYQSMGFKKIGKEDNFIIMKLTLDDYETSR